jgi:uncharacterized protein YceH (UPF0502 family)
MTRPEPVVTKMGRLTGHKENRYRQLLSGDATEEAGAGATASSAPPSKPAAPVVSPPVDDARLTALETKLDALRRDVDAIKERLSGALQG